MEEARKVAKAEGVAFNQLIHVAAAEKVSALRTEEYFAERAQRGDVREALRILKRAGVGQAPIDGDELSRGASCQAEATQRLIPALSTRERSRCCDLESSLQPLGKRARPSTGFARATSVMTAVRETGAADSPPRPLSSPASRFGRRAHVSVRYLMNSISR